MAFEVILFIFLRPTFLYLCAFQAIGNKYVYMKEEGKTYYEALTATAVYIRQEGVICASPVRNGNSINNWRNGDTTHDEIYM